MTLRQNLMDNDETNAELEDFEETTEVIEETPDEVAELQKRLATAEAQKKHWQKKAKAVETPKPKEESKETPEVPEATKDDLSQKDLYAMMTEKVPQEDVDEVVRASKALGISIPDALQSNIVKSLLSDRAEKRTTAEMTNTDNTVAGPTEVTDEELLSNAKKGELPDDDEGIQKLISAKLK